MSLAKDFEPQIDGCEEIAFPPSNLYSDELPLETDLHLRQMLLLIECLEWWWRDRQDFYLAGNLTIYYSPRQLKSELFRGPDFFVVLGTERKSRRSWTVWDEGGRYPNVIVELLSSSTAGTDRGLKKQIYQDIFRTLEYFWFDPANPAEFEGFALVQGVYQPIPIDDRGRRWSQQLQLFLGVEQSQLRYFTPEGQILPTPQELAQATLQRADDERQRADAEQQRADAERQRADAERQRADDERQRAEQAETQLQGAIASLLRANQSVEEVATLFGLPEERVRSLLGSLR